MVSKKKVIEVLHANFSYSSSDPVLKDCSLAIDDGDFLGIIGPNGGGKSTLLRIILGVIKPQTGNVRLLGDNPLKTRHRAGYIPQETSSNKEFPISVHDAVLMGLTSKKGIGHSFLKTDHSRTDSLLEELGLLPLRNRSISELSGGQRQKVLLARALVSDPEIIFLDEPTASIDTTGVDEIYDYLQKLNNKGTTVVLVTHNISIVSKYIKSIACINKELYFHPENEINSDTISRTFGCAVDIVAHGHPHRVFHNHSEKEAHGSSNV